MTPYFGVSLYIWSSILATTLFFLALGYYFGGLVSTKVKQDKLEVIFLCSPLAAAISIGFACLIYPVLFPILGWIDLLFGCFVGSLLLLSIPLICLSGMNPILIALERQQFQEGDAGAGRVFFISTIGSVFGVFITAFLLIPNLSNFNALLSISLFLITIVLVYAIFKRSIARGDRIKLLISSVLCAFLCILLLVSKHDYLKQLALIKAAPVEQSVIAEYNSLFGNTKVVEHIYNKNTPRELKTLMLVQDGHIFNNALPDGTSLDSYTYILEGLALKFSPQNDKVLVLGLGAGMVPMRMSRRGSQVTVVELDASIIRSAVEHFNFNEEDVHIVQEDARTFIRHCPQSYDTVVVDLFNGDGVPGYLMTTEFFSNLKSCLNQDGTLVMNIFYDVRRENINLHVPATLAQSFPVIYQAVLKDNNNQHIMASSYLVARENESRESEIPELEKMPWALKEIYSATLLTLRKIPIVSLADITAITDENNFYSVIYAKMQMAYRHQIIRAFSANLLVN